MKLIEVAASLFILVIILRLAVTLIAGISETESRTSDLRKKLYEEQQKRVEQVYETEAGESS